MLILAVDVLAVNLLAVNRPLSLNIVSKSVSYNPDSIEKYLIHLM